MHEECRRNARRSLLFGSAVAWIGLALTAVKLQTFPFFASERVDSVEFDQLDGAFVEVPVSADFRDIARRELGQAVSAANGDSLEAARPVARYVRSRLRKGDEERLSDPHRALTAPQPIPCLCSEYAKVFVALCQALGIPARVIWMERHTTAEVWGSDRRPFVADPNGNLVFRDANGKPMSVAQIVSGAPAVAEPLVSEDEVGSGRRDDPSFFGTEAIGVYHDPRLVFAIRGRDLFAFHSQNRSPMTVLRYLFGGEPVGRGKSLSDGEHLLIGWGRTTLWLGILSAATHLGILVSIAAPRPGKERSALS
jgi:hypothetical protein